MKLKRVLVSLWLLVLQKHNFPKFLVQRHRLTVKKGLQLHRLTYQAKVTDFVLIFVKTVSLFRIPLMNVKQ